MEKITTNPLDVIYDVNIGDLMNKLSTDFQGMFEQERAKSEAELPYQLTPIKFSKREIKRLNINERDNYCHITKNGKKVSDLIFRKGGFSSSIKDMNTKRFVELLTYDEDRYSDDTVKTCKLKSPYCLRSHNCVFDMEKHEIAFKTNDTLHDYIFIKDNLCIGKINDGVFFLPERRWILDKSYELEGYIETENYLYAYSGKYSAAKSVMYRIDRKSGDVINCNVI